MYRTSEFNQNATARNPNVIIYTYLPVECVICILGGQSLLSLLLRDKTTTAAAAAVFCNIVSDVITESRRDK